MSETYIVTLKVVVDEDCADIEDFTEIEIDAFNETNDEIEVTVLSAVEI